MLTPYQILNIAENASDLEIKQAYLLQVKNNPPDRDQQQFQLIHDAYSSVKDHKSRVSYALFTLPTVNFDALLDRALQTEQKPDLNVDYFNKILSLSMDDACLLSAFASTEKK